MKGGTKRIYFVKTFAFLILAFLFLKYYFIDVFIEYNKGSSTYTVLTQEVEHLPLPQITLCFNPLYKTSKIEEYDIKSVDGSKDYKYNMTNWELVQELSYENMMDFALSFR